MTETSLSNVVFKTKPKIGDIEQGWQITEVREDGAVFAVPGTLEAEIIDELKTHFAKPAKQRGMYFRPGRIIGKLSPEAQKN